MCRRAGVLLNLDAIQWIGALHMDLADAQGRFPVGGRAQMAAGADRNRLFLLPERGARIPCDPPNVGYHSVDKHEDHMDYDLTFRANAGRFEEALVNFPASGGSMRQ